MAKKKGSFIDTLKEGFNTDTLIGAGITVTAMALSYLGQNFVPESMDTKKKARPIALPLIVAFISSLLPKKEFKIHGIIGAAIMLMLGILKALDEEKSKDKRITGKIFGLDTLGGDPNEKRIEFNNLNEVGQFIQATQSQVNGSDGTVYDFVPLVNQTVQGDENGLYGDEDLSGDENGLYGDEDLSGDEGGLYGDVPAREYAGGMI
ncbi:conserved hypothetical protein [Leptospira interrogans serovar Manilae]|uniref:Uncharacterized protein n=1 Tax=Leptospira interrogans serovar Manilae TaxID=214675 RepID=A0AAQ1P2W0_LEPIR|nr:hypothetical protein [Leptospira interrogans]AKP25945.1 hypothetical protein LIMLP_08320 [Leptospira interrogans serovar Manilae]AKP29730.1 hypothetical protein LIMHP_08315 [Leptospira interrogans serovar Manilae]EYU62493.1 hypothetical protein CI00_20125 [Leptospira interrogans serovar Manilae]SOR63392.1 conserved hypothetical protein [Leptospira interrogans serovar Manilae]